MSWASAGSKGSDTVEENMATITTRPSRTNTASVNRSTVDGRYRPDGSSRVRAVTTRAAAVSSPRGGNSSEEGRGSLGVGVSGRPTCSTIACSAASSAAMTVPKQVGRSGRWTTSIRRPATSVDGVKITVAAT